jgi:outer membrane receptor protein involved in Fe transport
VRFDRPGQGAIFIYINNDFSRSRGFELQVKKRRDPFLSGFVTYEYTVATGKASDPNQLQLLQEVNGSFNEIGIEEGFLRWNRPHKLTLAFDYEVPEGYDLAKVPTLFGHRLPRDWFVNATFLLRSGRPYTPEDRTGLEIGKKYSENAPLTTSIDLRTEKGFRLLGDRKLRVSLEGRNILNSRYPTRIDPSTGDVPTIGRGQIDPVPNTPELAAAREAQVLQYQDPSWWTKPRSVWFGLGIDW